MALTAKKRSPRQNTSLESEGAEFLVLGNLLIEGIVARKTYTNNPGYDLVATLGSAVVCPLEMLLLVRRV